LLIYQGERDRELVPIEQRQDWTLDRPGGALTVDAKRMIGSHH